MHKRSKHKDAIPLLFCHTWPSSFIEAQRILDALSDPHSLPSFGDGAQQAFHVVVPSIPGFGFSDASLSEEFGLDGTARVFNQLMHQLGYEQYVAHGTGWSVCCQSTVTSKPLTRLRGFSICRALALQNPQYCLAVHTTNPSFVKPTYKRGPLVYAKYRIAQLTRAKIAFLSLATRPQKFKETPNRSTQRWSRTLSTLRGHLHYTDCTRFDRRHWLFPYVTRQWGFWQLCLT